MNYLSTLTDRNKTCIIYNKDTIIFESTKRGVQPLIDFHENNLTSAAHLILVDRIIGKGAVIIASLIGIKEIYTPIISKDALDLSRTYNIHCEYSKLVDYIKNREQTGRCPIESCVLEISDPKKGFERIQETLFALKKAT